MGAGTWLLGDRVVDRMGFGSMRITADPDPVRAVRVVRRAVELGVNHIDTAAFYVSPGGTLGVGDGPRRYATELIRRALAPYPEELVIATKVGFAVDGAGGVVEARSPAALRAQVIDNLRRLGRDHLDLVNLRIVKRPGRDSVAESFGALAQLRAEGLIRHLGLSNVRADHVAEATAIAPVVCVQNPYGVDFHRDDDALLDSLGAQGIGYVPFFALAGANRAAGATGTQPDAVRAVARRHGVTEHQVRIAWTLHRGPHVLAIPGTGDPDHLSANIAAAELRLSDAEMRSLDGT